MKRSERGTNPNKRKEKKELSKEEEDMIDEEVHLVWVAADLMLDPEERQERDEQVQAWRTKYV